MKFSFLIFFFSSFLWCQVTIIHAGKLICGTSKDMKHAYSILIEKEKLADIVAIKKEPLQKIGVLEKVVFVMKSGKVYKNLTTKK